MNKRDIMVYLVGYKTEYFPDDYGINDNKPFEEKTESLLATFDNEELANKFVNSCKLKKCIKNTWSNDEPFKRSSLLQGIGEVEILYDYYLNTDVPHNP